MAEPPEEPVPSGPAAGQLAGNVLWIDDHPADNRSLAQRFIRRGAAVTEAVGLDEARRLLMARTVPFDLLISDIGRDGRRDAGLEDLQALRDEGLYLGPAIFFANRITPARRTWAGTLDAAVTANAGELIRFVESRLPAAVDRTDGPAIKAATPA